LYTFVGFSIKDDKQMLKKSGLEINPKNFIDIQRNGRVPNTRKEYDSLADVAASVIHPFYKGMKKKIDKEEDHKLWGISPLPDKLIEYAGIDAYATYKSWKIIDNITTGWEISKEQEADPYYHCHYAG
jgi:ribonuclease D